MRRACIIGVILVCCGLAACLLYHWRMSVSADNHVSVSTNDQLNEKLLSALIQGCNDAVSAIKSGRGTLTEHEWDYTYEDPEGLLETETTYKLAFAGEKYRVSEKVTYLRNDADSSVRYPVKPGTKILTEAAFDGQKMTMFNPSCKRARVGSIGSSVAPAIMWGEHMRYKGGIMVVGSEPTMEGHGVSRIDKFVPSRYQTDKGLHVARRESLDGQECIVVERIIERSFPDGRKGTSTYEYWIDPTRGFMIPRIRVWGEGGPLRERTLLLESNTELRQYGDSLWGPAKYTHVRYKLDDKGGVQLDYRRVITYGDDFQLNVPVSDSELALKLPPGTLVHDTDLDETYTSP